MGKELFSAEGHAFDFNHCYCLAKIKIPEFLREGLRYIEILEYYDCKDWEVAVELILKNNKIKST